MKRMLSGIKPTGRVTLGNYIGAIKPFVSYQDEYEMIVFVANLHSMTTVSYTHLDVYKRQLLY